MKKQYFSVLGYPITKEQYYTERDRLSTLYLDTLKKNTGKDLHHVIAIEYLESGRHFLIDSLFRGDQFRRFVHDHKEAYIFARHSR